MTENNFIEKNETIKQQSGKQQLQEQDHKQPQNASQEQNVRYIVRIASKDLDGTLPIPRAIRSIKGISHRFALIAGYAFEKETGISFETKLGLIPETADKKLEEIVLNPEKYGFPDWVFNRRKDIETNQDMHLVMNELDFSLRKDIQRLMKMKSYKGHRHSIGQPVRGQRTRSSFRKRGSIVGVQKKDIKAKAKGKK